MQGHDTKSFGEKLFGNSILPVVISIKIMSKATHNMVLYVEVCKTWHNKFEEHNSVTFRYIPNICLEELHKQMLNWTLSIVLQIMLDKDKNDKPAIVSISHVYNINT